MKVTLNQKTNESIYKGEDKTFTCYAYDPATMEYIDLTDKTINVCLLNADNTKESIAADMGTEFANGYFSFTIDAATSIDLKEGSNPIQLEITDVPESTLDIEVLDNSFTVVAPIA